MTTKSICPECNGKGTKMYPNSGLWDETPGVIVFHAFREGVCDVCWGSGDHTNPGEDLRAKKKLEMEVKTKGIELIKANLADHKTSKAAAAIGLKIESIFRWVAGKPLLYREFPELTGYAAPLATEIPLPPKIITSYDKGYTYVYSFSNKKVYYRVSDVKEDGSLMLRRDFDYGYAHSVDNDNLPTALLKMVVDMVQNVPELRKWFIERGILEVKG